MSITHIGAVPVNVTDLERAADYYTRVLGLRLDKTITRPDGTAYMIWIGFPEGRAIFILVDAAAVGMSGQVGGFTGIVLDVDDAERTCAELQERGATFARPLVRGEDAWRAVVTDPDGNEFLLYQPADEKDRH